MNTRNDNQQGGTALIVGCGYLGTRLAQALIAQRSTIFGTTRSEQKAKHLAALGIRPLLLSVTEPLTYASLSRALQAHPLDVYYMIPPGRLDGSPSTRQTVLGGTAHMVRALKHAQVRRAILVSSTAVYGQTNGQRIDADTPAEPNGERAELMLQGEQLWLHAGQGFHVLRLAGIYGPGRVIGLKAVREQAPLIGDPEALLNLIHVDDAVSLLLAITHSESASPIELGCDGHPTPRIEYYTRLAELLNVAPPVTMDAQMAAIHLGLNPERLSRSSSKALDNRITRQRTGWEPAYPGFRAGLRALLNPGITAPPEPSGRTC